jgi:hypothetical protein
VDAYLRTSAAMDDYDADAYDAGGYGLEDDCNAGGNGNDDLFGGGGGTRDFLSMGPGSSPDGGYSGLSAGAYPHSGSSSLRPSRLHFDGLDLNAEHGWSEVQDLLRGDEVQGSDRPRPIRVPPRGQNRTLGLRGPRSVRGEGRAGASGRRRSGTSGTTAPPYAQGGGSAPFGAADLPAGCRPPRHETSASDEATRGGGRRRRRAVQVNLPLSSLIRCCFYEIVVQH